MAVLSSFAHAQQYPSKPVRLILGFGPGGATDVIARFYAQKWSEMLKTPVIVDNRPSAGQVIAVKTVMSAAPDGYTIFFGTGSAFSQGPGVRTDLPFDPLKDLTSDRPGVDCARGHRRYSQSSRPLRSRAHRVLEAESVEAELRFLRCRFCEPLADRASDESHRREADAHPVQIGR